MDRSIDRTSTFLSLFDIAGTIADSVAAPLIGSDDIDANFAMSVVQDDQEPEPVGLELL